MTPSFPRSVVRACATGCCFALAGIMLDQGSIYSAFLSGICAFGMLLDYCISPLTTRQEQGK